MLHKHAAEGIHPMGEASTTWASRSGRSELGVPVWAHENEVPVTEHPWRCDHERSRLPYFRHPRFVKIFTAMGGKGAFWVKGTREVRTYTDGQQLDVPGRPRVIFTPGHTYGHCSLHFGERGAVIVATARTATITGSETPIEISGIDSSCS